MSNYSLNLLRKEKTTVIHKLIYTAIKCDVNTCLYREYSSYLSICSNFIAFPLIIFTSILSIVATMQTVEVDNDNNNLHTNQDIKIFIAILSIFVAIISGLQKYFKFTERTEITKNYAKNFEKLGLRIESFLYEIKIKTIDSSESGTVFEKLINSIFNEFDILVSECDDQPSDMANKQFKLYKEKCKILNLLNTDKNKISIKTEIYTKIQKATEKETQTETENNNLICKPKKKSYKHCFVSFNNCLSFLCNCCSYEYKKHNIQDIDDINLIEFNNLDKIIENILNKNKSNNETISTSIQLNNLPPIIQMNPIQMIPIQNIPYIEYR
tara:strand:- start:9440 stop:10417 length:978 start_codon:yes stop_codon:yes gene_type:complete